MSARNASVRDGGILGIYRSHDDLLVARIGRNSQLSASEKNQPSQTSQTTHDGLLVECLVLQRLPLEQLAGQLERVDNSER